MKRAEEVCDPTPGVAPREHEPSEVLSTPKDTFGPPMVCPATTAWDIGPREAVALMSLSAPMSTGDPIAAKDCFGFQSQMRLL